MYVYNTFASVTLNINHIEHYYTREVAPARMIVNTFCVCLKNVQFGFGWGILSHQGYQVPWWHGYLRRGCHVTCSDYYYIACLFAFWILFHSCSDIHKAAKIWIGTNPFQDACMRWPWPLPTHGCAGSIGLKFCRVLPSRLGSQCFFVILEMFYIVCVMHVCTWGLDRNVP